VSNLAATERGRFFVLEGIDGAGTTTQTARLRAHLEGRGRRAVSTREPSGGPVGLLLREILLGRHVLPNGARFDGGAMALLFAADRRDHLSREIEPALAAGIDVISDRYVMSSLAYQAEEAARDLVIAGAAGLPRPDLTLLVDLPIDVAARRRAAAGRPVERYDADETLRRVAENYRRLAREEPRVLVIDGTPPVDEVAAGVARAVDDFLRGTAGAATLEP